MSSAPPRLGISSLTIYIVVQCIVVMREATFPILTAPASQPRFGPFLSLCAAVLIGWLAAGAAALLVADLVAAAAAGGRHGVWTVLLLLPSTTLLLVAPLARAVNGDTEWPSLAAAAVGITALTGVVLALADAYQRRRTHPEPARCPTRGRT